MGSTSYNVDLSRKTADILADDLNEKYEVVDSSTKSGVCYLAVRDKTDGLVSAVVVLFRRTPKDYYNFWCKWIDEGMGPGEADCPDRILDKLSPTTSEWANEWRSNCRASNVRANAAKKIEPGTVLEFPPMTFSDGVSRTRFTFITRSTFRSADGVLVNITSWRKRAFTVASSDETVVEAA